MHINVQKLRVAVTAGGQGIGYAIASAFHTNGAQVHICDIDAERLRHCKETLLGLGTSIADVSEPAQVEAFIGDARTNLGGIDVLVNNAGIAGPTAASGGYLS